MYWGVVLFVCAQLTMLMLCHTHSVNVLVTVQLTRAGNCRAQVRKRSPTGLQHSMTRRFFLTCQEFANMIKSTAHYSDYTT